MSDVTILLTDLDTCLVFDEPALREITGAAGMAPMELLALFFDDSDNNIATMAQALSAGDHATFHRTAHSMKSSAGNVGAQRIALTAQALEMQTKQRLSDETTALFTALKTHYQEFSRAIALKKEALLF